MIAPGSEDVLVTPIWRETLTDDERWNVSRTIEAMPGTDHVFLADRSLDTTAYRSWFPDSRIVRSRETAFGTRWQYSRTMLDARLYDAFRGHRFLVVAQTDAFLVDSLAEPLATAGWDYAGAPFIAEYRMSALTTYSRRMGDLEQLVRPRVLCRIGNGGLSVRRVDAFRRVLGARPLLRRFSRMNEDLVLAHLGERGALRLPSWEEADALFFDESEQDPLQAEVRGFHALQLKHPRAYRTMRERHPTVGRWVSPKTSW